MMYGHASNYELNQEILRAATHPRTVASELIELRSELETANNAVSGMNRQIEELEEMLTIATFENKQAEARVKELEEVVAYYLTNGVSALKGGKIG